ncbi:unnamed protein product [Prorocentrum cordatum]|uniref:EF-hand domain-containing protein n=1 Tax=Prorocentrum cordatum TaxID=2364126 RepID=A0ABN9SME1_9DINO|nr:unnamed protein product [Polarella glacialis]
MASRAGGLAAQERFLQCCRRVDAAGSGTVPSKGLAVFLQRLGLEQQEVEGLLLEADAGGGCTDYVKLAGALWVSGPEGDDEASASSELRGEACAVVPDGGVREAGDEQPVPDATLDEAVPQHSFGLPIARKEAPRGAAEGAAGEPARQTLQDGSVYEGQLSPGGERNGTAGAGSASGASTRANGCTTRCMATASSYPPTEACTMGSGWRIASGPAAASPGRGGPSTSAPFGTACNTAGARSLGPMAVRTRGSSRTASSTAEACTASRRASSASRSGTKASLCSGLRVP